jgi:MFS family permease
LLDTYGGPLLTIAIAVAVIVAAIRRWSWAFLVIGVLLALYGLLRAYNLLVNVILFPALPPPPWGPVPKPDVGFEGVFGLAALVLLLFVTVALATCERASAVRSG